VNAEAMRGANDFDPLRRAEFVGGKNMPDFVVEDFCRGSG
jgi:hypothetical protein